MRGVRRRGWLRLVAGVLLALVTTVASGHRAGAAVPGLVDLQAYALPDGSLPWICVFGHGERGDDAPATACAFGLLAAVPLQAAEPPDLAPPDRVVYLSRPLPAGVSSVVPTDAAPRPRPRAPPIP